MIKLMIFGRRRAGMTRRMLSSHLRCIHGPMVCAAPRDAGILPVRYVQNHVFDGTHGADGGDHALDRDFVTELWFDRLEDMIAGRKTAYYRKFLEPDEWRFVDQETVVAMPVQERELRPRRTAQERGLFKGFVFAKAAAGREESFLDAWRAAREEVLEAQPVPPLSQVENLPLHAGPGRFAAIVDEFAYPTADAAHALIDQTATLLSRLGDIGGASACSVLLAEQFSATRILRDLAPMAGAPEGSSSPRSSLDHNGSPGRI